ncbi:peptide-methionine (S)-S-oxide reductase [Rhodothalassium salexigens DSM 2132]|uniref:Peptide methionine sulfoxide reductase MsrA n=1 Tax=Rhodothalassium salexigens DSM 2132 TaxID=1188247 RepID=A0A4R2PR36_RHOSA|nr:peptide-methionine (S)-S-oxide reductase MsrA [Rhodothalassium salexigens]MBB4210002.1 peptide-methionine (S)-S-oxide reductase [Rhodothalassium salexigens DSM 2132]MBK1637626.1 peptide-methionine (S)-S-oxide reductase [Rhodothalassium salexigens DSM 2132]TCP38167.1 peptide-methionine (S)-S-oxide reductase [Rhodothalassium salexigens DSM 2132]
MAQQAKATLAGGCFWCIEAVMNDLVGVRDAVSGYMGGAVDNPTYRQVCTGQTGHAEVVQVTFDPEVIGLDQILDVFFTVHDPTQLNRQGADVGTQYRSAIFTHGDDQADAARRAIDRAAEIWGDGIVTEVTPAATFWPAEAYHQRYFATNPEQPFCQAVIGPKVAKARAKYRHLLKSAA